MKLLLAYTWHFTNWFMCVWWLATAARASFLSINRVSYTVATVASLLMAGVFLALMHFSRKYLREVKDDRMWRELTEMGNMRQGAHDDLP